MQTFLPEYKFSDCAKVLDQKRLVKQLLEGRQIMTALSGNSKGWVNHPATKMWRGSGGVLYQYLEAIASEMGNRGYKWENNWAEIEDMYGKYFQDEMDSPDWLVDYRQHSMVRETHRGRLHIKSPELYPQYYFESTIYESSVCCERCNYYWPTHVKENA